MQSDRQERTLLRERCERERAMKSLARSFAVCGAIALLSSIGMFLLLTLGAHLPRIWPVPLAVACERANTLALGIWVFVIVFALGIMRVVLRELRRRAFYELRQRTTERESDEDGKGVS